MKIAHATLMPTLPSQKAWLVMTSDNHSRLPQPSSPREGERDREMERERTTHKGGLPPGQGSRKERKEERIKRY